MRFNFFAILRRRWKQKSFKTAITRAHTSFGLTDDTEGRAAGQPMRQRPSGWIRENSFRDRAPGVRRIEAQRLNPPALPAGSRSSRGTTPNISFRFFPLD